MRQIVIATHAHFADGILESLELLGGARENVRALSMFVDGRDDIALEAARVLDETPADDELIVCTDLFGGSVNNEFTKLLAAHPHLHLVTNINLPVLIQLLFAPDKVPTAELLREIAVSDDTCVKYVNDLFVEDGEDEDF